MNRRCCVPSCVRRGRGGGGGGSREEGGPPRSPPLVGGVAEPSAASLSALAAESLRGST